MAKIGDEIRKYRKKRGLSQKELGEKLQVSQAMIAQYENGKRIPKITTLLNIAAALHIDSLPLLEIYQHDTSAIGLDIDEKEYSLYKAHEESKTLRDVTIEPSDDLFTIDGVIISDQKLLKEFHSLNALGKKEAITRVSELKHIPGYSGDDGIPFN